MPNRRGCEERICFAAIDSKKTHSKYNILTLSTKFLQHDNDTNTAITNILEYNLKPESSYLFSYQDGLALLLNNTTCDLQV